MEPFVANQEQKQNYLNNLMKRFEAGDAKLEPTVRTLIGKFTESRRAAEQISTQLDGLRKNLESGSQQLQQEIGRGGGYLEALLALCPPKSVEETVPANTAQPSEPVSPGQAIPINRHQRRAAAKTEAPEEKK